MKKISQRHRKKRKALEYVLEDFLELKAELDRRQAKKIKEFIFSKELTDHHLFGVEGFHLAEQLVLIGPANPHRFEHLVFLNPEDGAIQIRRISKED